MVFSILCFIYNSIFVYNVNGDYMKVRIKSGECPSYLTHDKWYEASPSKAYDCIIESDCGELIGIDFKDSDFLNGGSWEIVE